MPNKLLLAWTAQYSEWKVKSLTNSSKSIDSVTCHPRKGPVKRMRLDPGSGGGKHAADPTVLRWRTDTIDLTNIVRELTDAAGAR